MRYCEECGKAMSDDATCCSFCGTQVQDYQSGFVNVIPSNKPNAQKKPSRVSELFNGMKAINNERKFVIAGILVGVMILLWSCYYNFAYYSENEIQDAVKLRNDQKLIRVFDYSIKSPRHEKLATAAIKGITEVKGKDGINRLNAFIYKSDNDKENLEYTDQLKLIIVSASQSNKLIILPVYADIVKSPQHPLRSVVIDAIKYTEPTWFVGKIKELFPKPGYYSNYDTKSKVTAEENLENVGKQCQLLVVDSETKETCAKEKAKRYGEILKSKIAGDAMDRNAVIDKIELSLADVYASGATRYINILRSRANEYEPVNNAYRRLTSESSDLWSRQKKIEDRMISLKGQYAILQGYAQQGFAGDNEIRKGLEISNEFMRLTFERNDVQNQRNFIDQRKERVEKDEIRLRTAIIATVDQFF